MVVDVGGSCSCSLSGFGSGQVSSPRELFHESRHGPVVALGGPCCRRLAAHRSPVVFPPSGTLPGGWEENREATDPRAIHAKIPGLSSPKLQLRPKNWKKSPFLRGCMIFCLLNFLWLYRNIREVTKTIQTKTPGLYPTPNLSYGQKTEKSQFLRGCVMFGLIFFCDVI